MNDREIGSSSRTSFGSGDNRHTKTMCFLYIFRINSSEEGQREAVVKADGTLSVMTLYLPC